VSYLVPNEFKALSRRGELVSSAERGGARSYLVRAEINDATIVEKV
jgi:hypothetical protein